MKRGLFIKLDYEERKNLLMRAILKKIPELHRDELHQIVNSIPLEYQYNIKVLTSKDEFINLNENDKTILFIYKENNNWACSILKYMNRPSNKEYDLNIYKG